jgi:hypothetical protein
MNVRRPDPDKLRAMRVILKAAYDAVAAEPVPQSMHDLIKRLP